MEVELAPTTRLLLMAEILVLKHSSSMNFCFPLILRFMEKYEDYLETCGLVDLIVT